MGKVNPYIAVCMQCHENSYYAYNVPSLATFGMLGKPIVVSLRQLVSGYVAVWEWFTYKPGHSQSLPLTGQVKMRSPFFRSRPMWNRQSVLTVMSLMASQ